MILAIPKLNKSVHIDHRDIMLREKKVRGMTEIEIASFTVQSGSLWRGIFTGNTFCFSNKVNQYCVWGGGDMQTLHVNDGNNNELQTHFLNQQKMWWTPHLVAGSGGEQVCDWLRWGINCHYSIAMFTTMRGALDNTHISITLCVSVSI